MKSFRYKSQLGMSLLELMFAGFVMVVGMLGSLILIATAIASNTRNRIDTTGTAVSQLVMEQINSTSSQKGANLNVKDCTGADHTVATSGNTIVSGGAGAPLISNANPAWNLAGTIDFTIAYATVPANYKMLFITCGGTTYDVRWNIMNLSSTNTASGFNPGSVTYTRLITVSARQLGITGQQSQDIRLFAPPITLRAINGP
jgi:Tfp pilus assembly protein PilV